MFFKSHNLNRFCENKCIVYYYNLKDYNVYTYDNIINACNEVINSITMCRKLTNVVGILFSHEPSIIPLILGILNSNVAFTFIDPLLSESEIADLCHRLNIGLLYTKRGIKFKSFVFANATPLSILNSDIMLWTVQVGNNLNQEINNICYCIQTSGTTGEAKFVRVPFECIMPNVTNLISKVELHSSDAILITTPPTFDPFILDVFMTLSVGASMVLMSNTFRLSHRETAKCGLFINLITYMQCTPSFFKMWTRDEIINVILNPNSRLRVLILGGEEFPNLQQFLPACTKKRIFNIYGITEVSCWSTIKEIQTNDEEIDIGNCLDEGTILEIRDLETNKTIKSDGIGELYIGSISRICQINNEPSDTLNSSEVVFRPTGDIFKKVQNDNGVSFFFQGRTNQTIKKFGVKVNLHRISHTAAKCTNISSSHCMFIDGKIVLFFTTSNENDIQTNLQLFLVSNLNAHEIPDYNLKIEQFPLTSHGKISNEELRKMFIYRQACKKNNLLGDEFLDQIYKYTALKITPSLNTAPKRTKTHFESSFIDVGGTSMQAIQIVQYLEHTFKTVLPNLLEFLITSSVTIKDAYTYLMKINNLQTECVSVVNNSNSMITIDTKYYLNKCVDASPSTCIYDSTRIGSVGSHSHRIININLDTNSVISSLELPDRIESKIVFHLKHGIVGCYNGYLYCYNLFTGLIKWAFDCLGMIKSKSVIFPEHNLVVCGNYNQEFNVWAVSLDTGRLVYKKMIGEKSVSASPLQIGRDHIIITTLNGNCCLVNAKNGVVKWTSKMDSPVFSSPNFIERLNVVIVAAVSGVIKFVNINTGDQMCSIIINGNIFSSFEIMDNYIYFGCHDHHLYCYELQEGSLFTVKKIWASNLSSPIFATPVLDASTKENIIVCTTTGHIYMLDRFNGTTQSQINLPGEIFSSPCISNTNLLVGCRDNNLYQINLNKIKTL